MEAGGISFLGLVMIVMLAGGAWTFAKYRQKKSAPRFATEEEARREAVRMYPALGQANSQLNRDFVARYRAYKSQQPEYFRETDWPLRLAAEVSPATAVSPEGTPYPEYLRTPFAVMLRKYTKVDAKKWPPKPADSLWLFRAPHGAEGTVEVAFEGSKVVYMLFRHGVGGRPWSGPEVEALLATYRSELFSLQTESADYRAQPIKQINAAAIYRRDFDPQQLQNRS